MKVIEKPWKYGTYLGYDEIEPEFLATTKGVRVLPAPFFYDKKLYFELWKRYEPGEKPTFPNGGYEVVDISGGIRSFDLDQVIIHPAVLKHRKMLDKMARKAEKKERHKARQLKKMVKENKPKHGRRGRPALDPALKAQRDASKAQTQVRSGGKRGRPRSLEPKAVSTVSAPGRRGRPALDPQVKLQREKDKAALKQKIGRAHV